jgi:hypothetical protein
MVTLTKINPVNCWKLLRVPTATTKFEKTIVTALKSVGNWTISSQAACENVRKVQRLKPKAKANFCHADNRVALINKGECRGSFELKNERTRYSLCLIEKLGGSCQSQIVVNARSVCRGNKV